MLKMAIYTVLGLMIIIAGLLFYGSLRWQCATKTILGKLEKGRISLQTKIYCPSELSELPGPVQRYFRAVLKEGQPIITAVTMEHAGTFNMSETREKWKPFSSIQKVITQRPGFDWEARINIMPGLKVHVHDAYIVGEGILQASLLGFLSLASLRGTSELAQGELLRFLAEAVWYPTALLPSQGVRWQAVTDNSARASLQDANTSVSLLFHFAENGLIESVRAESRGRMVTGKIIPTPWQGRWGKYELRQGMRIPMEGEVAWLLPEGPKPYWRGRLIRINYDFAE